ncbi:Na/Pi cotransporter family protein [Hydrogenophaga sp.]|uniref:Na/Pi cotransporter family protein n=1 Tax=Hydrogenophaga sp. TaxID=1904254 RepID=UPI0019C4079E|nr:Na/Pi cotransporter family protein [Hydrogenophaga sp.]MBD3892395.1 Na/Pi cotransporter family protein [Hydrogenophaga sp.]
MTLWTSASLLAGGLGLFLLGMNMMTDGLKHAAGPALHQILRNATRTRWHALSSGVLVTTVVQSSSAVTVATIGFVNAGLLGLAPALWVLFGANVGTTMTGWIVALIGLEFDVETLALPLVALGVLLRLSSSEQQRRGAIGTAMAGFGLLFLGIGLMQQSFAGLDEYITLPQGTGFFAVLAQLSIGMVLTVLMQSSSASMAIVLTAAQGGLIDLQSAAAAVIGANIGTTVTALLAAIGATPNARRAAAAHVIFNLQTGAVALLLLPWWIPLLQTLRDYLGLQTGPAVLLALFHTSFNLLGVLLMWPLANALTRWLQRHFRAREEDLGQPRHLDDNVLPVPSLALQALEREVERFGQMCVALARRVLSGASVELLRDERNAIASLDAAVEAFVERMSRGALSIPASQRLAELLRVQRYYETCADLSFAAAPLSAPGVDDEKIQQQHQAFISATLQLLAEHDAAPATAAPRAALDLRPMESAYQQLKASVLACAATAALALDEMETQLDRYSSLRRAMQQAVKARLRLLPQA